RSRGTGNRPDRRRAARPPPRSRSCRSTAAAGGGAPRSPHPRAEGSSAAPSSWALLPPAPGVLDDGLDAGDARLPAQHVGGEPRVGDQRGWIAGPAAALSRGDLLAAHLLDGRDHLAHRVPASRAEIDVEGGG